MKKILSLTMIFVLVCSFNVSSFAVVNNNEIFARSDIEYLEDGSYIVTEITVGNSDFSVAAANTKSGSKTIKHYGSNNELQWTATIKGTFSYTGSTAMCTASSITYSILDDSWKITSATASKTMNKAVGNVTAKHYFLGIPIKTVEETITLICSASGVLS